MTEVHKFSTTSTHHTSDHEITGPALFMLERARRYWGALMKESLPFEVGRTYYRMDGVIVECIELSDECALFSDWYPPSKEQLTREPEWLRCKPTDRLGWRYNRPDDRGRCTGSRHDLFTTVVPDFPEGFREELHDGKKDAEFVGQTFAITSMYDIEQAEGIE